MGGYKAHMIRVKITGEITDWPLLRQTPGSKGVWGDCQFFVNDDTAECEYWVVYDGISAAETVRCPPENVILFTAEPPPIRAYHPRFLAQFAAVVTCQERIKHPGVIREQQALPWHLMNKSYDDLAFGPPPEKTGTLSVICSDKAWTEGHRRRLDFVQRLKASLGEGLDYYGQGARVPKWGGSAPYKYTIAIENSCYRDYWTEKIADAFLVDAYPFYYGCPNIGEYFPAESFTWIEIGEFEAARDTIHRTIQRNEYEASVEARATAKDLILNKYNLFPVVAVMTSASRARLPKRPVLLRPDAVMANTPIHRARQIVKKVIRYRL